MIAEEEILSYYRVDRNGFVTREFLSEHISKALSYIKDIKHSRIGRFVENNLHVTNFEKLVRLAIVLHDAGKAFYQNSSYLREKDGEKYLSFLGHEFISAIIADHFAKEKIMEEYDFTYTAIVFAIFYHHHAMNVHSRQKTIKNLSSLDVRTFSRFKNRLKDTLTSFLTGEDARIVGKCVDNLNESFSPADLRSIEKEIDERLIVRGRPEDIILKKLSFIVLNCLITCDYLSARGRGDYESDFYRAITNFYESWLGQSQSA
ncbi:MAG: CRISPR-associated endonuclease Cas3'' [Nitrososphaerota archaeon]|nr:CRISPR-associated endonuclease Cas3'' [Aigarchaeota archaeon]MDW8077129.1 CRISPR-associated endonuclease Cas3'' [Nitrososphaerota archaeon]